MTTKQRNAVRTGYVLGGALGLVRFTGARTVQDATLAGALMAVELSVIWLVEWKAAKWEVDNDAYRAKESLRAQRESQAKETGSELARRQHVLDETKQEMRNIEGAIRHDHLMSDLKVLLNIAVNAVRNGYHEGIAHNYAVLGGHKGEAA